MIAILTLASHPDWVTLLGLASFHTPAHTQQLHNLCLILHPDGAELRYAC